MADLDLTVAQESADRWQACQQQREEKRSVIREGRISSVESPERIQKRLDRLTAAAPHKLGHE